MRSRTTTLASWSLPGLLFGVGACGAMPERLDGAGGRANEPIASDTAELPLVCGIADVTTRTKRTFYTLPLQGDASFCWISSLWAAEDGLTGDAAPHWPRGQLYYSPGGWTAGTTNDGDYGITCVPKDCFFSNGGGADKRWISEGSHGAQSSGSPLGCSSDSTNAWWGDAATVLNGWEGSGLTKQTGDRAFVTQNNLSDSPSTVTNRDCTFSDGQNARNAQSTSLFVGIPGGEHQAVFRGPNSTRSYGIQNAGDYVSKSWDSTFFVHMADVNEGICYFSYLAGDFHRPEDVAKIYPVFNSGRWRWALRTTKASGGNNASTGIRAHARCYLFDQNQ